MTNFEYMTKNPEILAKEFFEMVKDCDKCHCPAMQFCNGTTETCEQAIVKWLKQERIRKGIEKVHITVAKISWEKDFSLIPIVYRKITIAFPILADKAMLYEFDSIRGQFRAAYQGYCNIFLENRNKVIE